MKVFKPIGSKDRLFEVFQNVNKIRINENLNELNKANIDVMNTLKIAFEQLKSGTLSVKQSKTQANDTESFIELFCVDKQGNNITFTFKISSLEGDQENVFNVDNVELDSFSFESNDGEDVIDLDSQSLKQFNQQYGPEFFNVIENFVDFESPEEVDELDEAIKLIDSIKRDSYPFGGSPDNMQSGVNYVDNKPTNPEVRVSAPELGKTIQEMSTFRGVDKINPEVHKWVLAHLWSGSFNGSVKVAIFGRMKNKETGEKSYKIFREKPVAFVPYETLNRPDVAFLEGKAAKEFLRQQGYGVSQSDKTLKKIGGVSENQLQTANVSDKSPVDNLPPQKKKIILTAIDNLTRKKGRPKYALNTQEINGEIQRILSSGEMQDNSITEEDKKSDYPTPIGKEFSPKKKYPKEKKRHDNKVKIGESTDNDRYENVVFLQGDEAYQPLEIIDREGVDAALEYLKQWHYPGEHAGSQTESHGSEDKVYRKDGYIMSWNPRLDYIGLQFDLSKSSELGEGDVYKRGGRNLNVKRKSNELQRMSEEESETLMGNKEVVSDLDIKKLAQDKADGGEVLVGGLGDGKSPLDFDPDQILKGLEVEMEHTQDPSIALEIVLDHLSEQPDYYTTKDTPEMSAQANASMKVNKNKHPLADVLDSDGDEENLSITNSSIESGVNRALEPGDGEYSNDKETTDALLGYKPKNVGDDVIDEASKEQELKQRDPASWHQLQVAKKTLKMPDAMVSVIGGMSKEEAKEIIRKNGLKNI